jgi:SAM-dependent methyltransferase
VASTGAGDAQSSSPSLLHRFGWLPLYPLVFVFTAVVKFKNRKLATDENYMRHQMEFFGFSRRLQDRFGRDFLAPSDKFVQQRPIINQYALSGQDGWPFKVLDVATGCGFQAMSLKEAGAQEVCAIDIVAERVQQACKSYGNRGITFARMDAAHMTYATDSFDAAVISCALHDMPTKTKRAVLSEMVRVVRTGGNVVIFEPRTFASAPVGFLLGLLGELLDESLNIQEYVMDDLNPVLAELGLELVEEQNVSTFKLLNIKHCRVTAGLDPCGPEERATCTTHV